MNRIYLFVFVLSMQFSFGQNPEFIRTEEEHITYYNDGVTAIHRWFNKKNKLDSLKSYYKNGKLDEEFYYTNGRFNGQAYKYNREGEIITTWEFLKGRLIKRTDHKLVYNAKNEQKIREAHEKLKKLNDSGGNLKGLKNHSSRAMLRVRLGNYTLAHHDLIRLQHYITKSEAPESIKNKLLSNVYDAISNIFVRYEMENATIHFSLKAIKAAPDNMRLYYNLGAHLFVNNCYRLSKKYLDFVLKHKPKHPFAHRLLGVLCSDFEEYEQALKHINLAFDNEKSILNHSDGRLERDLRTTRGYILHKLGRTVEGIADLKQAIALNENNSYAHKNLGIVYHDIGEYDKACELLTKAKEFGYKKVHDADDLEAYIKNSCSNKSFENPSRLTDLPYVYPNPARDFVKVGNISNDKLPYTLLNFESKIVEQGILMNYTIDTSKLPTGLYILIVEENGNIHSFKIIKD